MMQLQSREKVAYLTALTLLFSYVEMILPRIIPFFRLGLGNIAILMALGMPFSSFMLLSLLKATAASLMGGILFSPFYLVSLLQSFFSALVMYGIFLLNKKCKDKLISVYGISVTGSAVSALVQIISCAFYLGEGTYVLLGPMLIFNTASGIITAYISTKISGEIKSDSLEKILRTESSKRVNDENKNHSFSQILYLFVLLVFSASLFFIDNIYILIAALVISFIAQKISGRKILLLPHLSLWIFIFLSTLVIPEGRVVFRIWNFGITQGALITALEKSLRLSAVSALSQCAVSLKPSEESLLGLILAYYRTLSESFRNSSGNIFSRVKITLCK
ncbi:Gx transporter family protein [Treponema sp.]|uniref:Gx transporter family protein n=1 Tax=Treponema sp. TaxID=166 RepID=UPI0025D47A7B|nr:Gx transporter family protein [Treponema sp.]MCR5218959.1 Gx transporter family protein [Treponema sp.]